MHRWPKKNLVPTPQPQHQSPPSKQCQSQKAKNDDKALQTTEPSRAPNRRIGGKRTAPKCVIRLVKWIEFKPGRSTGPTENGRSSRSSDDLSKEEMWPTRTVAVALVGVRRSEDEGRESHREKERKGPPPKGSSRTRGVRRSEDEGRASHRKKEKCGACRWPEPGKV